MSNTFRNGKRQFFSVAKTSEASLDELGAKSPQYWHILEEKDYYEILRYNLWFNDLFIMGNDIMHQVTGTAIGGYISAQDADIYLMEREASATWVFLLQNLFLARFRDNLMYFCPAKDLHFWSNYLPQFFDSLYDIRVETEQLGYSLCFLEAQIECHKCNIDWGLKNKVLLSKLTTAPIVRRYPTLRESHAHEVVHGMAVSLAKKCIHVASTETHILSNVAHVIWEFHFCKYPTSWWLPYLKLTFSKRNMVINSRELLDHPVWRCPIPPKYCLFDGDTPPYRSIDLHAQPLSQQFLIDLYNKFLLQPLQQVLHQYGPWPRAPDLPFDRGRHRHREDENAEGKNKKRVRYNPPERLAPSAKTPKLNLKRRTPDTEIFGATGNLQAPGPRKRHKPDFLAF